MLSHEHVQSIMKSQQKIQKTLLEHSKGVRDRIAEEAARELVFAMKWDLPDRVHSGEHAGTDRNVNTGKSLEVSKSVTSVGELAGYWDKRLGPDPQEPLYPTMDFGFPDVADMKISVCFCKTVCQPTFHSILLKRRFWAPPIGRVLTVLDDSLHQVKKNIPRTLSQFGEEWSCRKGWGETPAQITSVEIRQCFWFLERCKQRFMGQKLPLTQICPGSPRSEQCWVEGPAISHFLSLVITKVLLLGPGRTWDSSQSSNK